MTDTRIFLEDLGTMNGWTILRRYGPQVRRERLPRYIVSTPDGHHLEEFRRLASAQAWCTRNHDYATKQAEDDEV